MSGSGHKKLIANTREKAISDDFNRAQAFVAALRSEWLRLWTFRKSADETGGTVISDPIIPTAPITGAPQSDVFEGLTVLPQVGTTSVHVLGGIVGMVDPDVVVNLDDSPYKLVFDPGIDTNGALTVGVNASGLIRIDVVECRRRELVTEDDNRDVFNNTTSVFTPTLVDKVSEGRLIFRARQGTPGAGFPGVADGWLPLAVASVPDGSTNTDDVTFWDVRPLVSDRTFPPGTYEGGFPRPVHVDQHEMYVESESTSGAQLKLQGFVRADFGFTSQRVGGFLKKGTPGGDAGNVDLLDTENHEPGFAVLDEEIYYVWLLFPEGLPRWVRYNRLPLSGARFPSHTKGFVVLSKKAPNVTSQLPSSAITPPTITGLTNATSLAVCIAAGVGSSSNAPGRLLAEDGWIYPQPRTPAVVPTTVSSSIERYTLTSGTHFPPHARMVIARVEFRNDGMAGDIFRYEANASLRETSSGSSAQLEVPQPGPGIVTFTMTGGVDFVKVDLVLPRIMPWVSSGLSDDIFFEISWALGGTFTKSLEQAQVIAWKL